MPAETQATRNSTRPSLQRQTDTLIVERNQLIDEIRRLEDAQASGDISSETRIRLERARRKLDRVTAELVELHKGLVVSYVSQFRRRGAEAGEDYQSAGMLGLMRAIDSYNPHGGSTFASWARRYIKRHVIQDLQTTEYPHIGKSDFDQRPAVLRAERMLRQLAPGYEPTDEEIASETGCTVAQVRRIRNTPTTVSLDSPVGDSSEPGATALSEVISDDDMAIEDRVITQMALEAISAYGLECLDARERYVLIRRLGLDGEPPDKLHSIGRHLGASRETSRNIEAKAIAKLNHPTILAQIVPGASEADTNAA